MTFVIKILYITVLFSNLSYISKALIISVLCIILNILKYSILYFFKKRILGVFRNLFFKKYRLKKLIKKSCFRDKTALNN